MIIDIISGNCSPTLLLQGLTSIGQKKSFSVIIEGSINTEILSASLVWDDGTFQVRSPIVVYGKVDVITWSKNTIYVDTLKQTKLMRKAIQSNLVPPPP
ncbi:hypothetical protein JHK87_005204 [Glycine soja]|nr:hypothetical protein JHK87_005204 [Glycine soja]